MGFLNPLGLLLSIFVVGLVLLYLWERNRRRFDVPSMILWEVVPESVVRRRRFQPDILFWLQLAALVCLILALANPYFEWGQRDGSPGRAILVLDLSASMQTVEQKTSRLDLAREAVARFILSASPETDLMLVGTAREPKVIAPFGTDHDRILELVTGLEARDVAGKLDPALAMARRLAFQAPTRTQIHVFTDLPRESVRDPWRDQVNWWPCGSTDDNLAITNVETSRGVLQDARHAGARVTIKNFSGNSKHGAITLAVGGKPFARELFTSPPRGESTFHFTDIVAAGVVEVDLETEDALAIDNHWNGWLLPFRPLRVALLGATGELRSAIVRLANATDSLEIVAADTTAGLDPTKVDVAIYDRATPQPLPAVPSLLIAPRVDPVSGQPAPELENIDVLDWSEQQEILRGIDVRLLRTFEKGVRLEPPPWSQSVLVTHAAEQDLPVLAIGTPQQHRVAILTPDLSGERLLASDHETTLLLFLNILDWLAAGEDDVPVIRTGESKSLKSIAGDVTEVVDPRGRTSVPAGADAFVSFDFAGTYELRRRDRPPVRIVANFHDNAESDIGREPASPYEAAEPERRTASTRTAAGLRPWLLVAAAALLVGEWYAAGRVRTDG
jgi:hypothetical protein